MKPFLCRIAEGFKLLIEFILGIFDSLFNKHKLIRRTIIIWLLAVLTYILISMMNLLTPELMVSVYNKTLAAFGAFTGFYVYLRNKDGD